MGVGLEVRQVLTQLIVACRASLGADWTRRSTISRAAGLTTILDWSTLLGWSCSARSRLNR